MKIQTFRILGVDFLGPWPPAAAGFSSRTPPIGGWGLRPQTTNDLQQLGAPPQIPETAPRSDFLAMRLCKWL